MASGQNQSVVSVPDWTNYMFNLRCASVLETERNKKKKKRKKKRGRSSAAPRSHSKKEEESVEYRPQRDVDCWDRAIFEIVH